MFSLKGFFWGMAAGAVTLIAAGNANAAIVGTLVMPADYSGKRTVPAGEIVTTPTPSDWDALEIDYLVEDLGDSFRFTYTIDTMSGAKASISHFTVAVSEGFDITNADDVVDASAGNTDDPTLQVEDGSGLPTGFGSSVLKWDESGHTNGTDEDPEGPYVFSVTTKRVPNWNNFFLKDGTVDAWNKGIDDLTSDDKQWFIPTPDTEYKVPPPVPVPAAVWMGLPILAGLGIAKRRTMKG